MTGDDEERKQNAVNMEQDMSSSSCAAKMHEISDGQLQMLLKIKTKIMSTDLLLSKLNEMKKEAQGYKTTINIQRLQITELEKHLVSSNLDYKILQCEHSKLNDVSVKLVALEQQNQQLSALLEQRNSQLNRDVEMKEETCTRSADTKFANAGEKDTAAADKIVCDIKSSCMVENSSCEINGDDTELNMDIKTPQISSLPSVPYIDLSLFGADQFPDLSGDWLDSFNTNFDCNFTELSIRKQQQSTRQNPEVLVVAEYIQGLPIASTATNKTAENSPVKQSFALTPAKFVPPQHCVAAPLTQAEQGPDKDLTQIKEENSMEQSKHGSSYETEIVEFCRDKNSFRGDLNVVMVPKSTQAKYNEPHKEKNEATFTMTKKIIPSINDAIVQEKSTTKEFQETAMKKYTKKFDPKEICFKLTPSAPLPALMVRSSTYREFKTGNNSKSVKINPETHIINPPTLLQAANTEVHNNCNLKYQELKVNTSCGTRGLGRISRVSSGLPRNKTKSNVVSEKYYKAPETKKVVEHESLTVKSNVVKNESTIVDCQSLGLILSSDSESDSMCEIEKVNTEENISVIDEIAVSDSEGEIQVLSVKTSNKSWKGSEMEALLTQNPIKRQEIVQENVQQMCNLKNNDIPARTKCIKKEQIDMIEKREALRKKLLVKRRVSKSEVNKKESMAIESSLLEHKQSKVVKRISRPVTEEEFHVVYQKISPESSDSSQFAVDKSIIRKSKVRKVCYSSSEENGEDLHEDTCVSNPQLSSGEMKEGRAQNVSLEVKSSVAGDNMDITEECVAKPMLHNLLRLISESTFDLEDTVCQMQQWYTSSSLASIAEALLVAVANISKKENDLFISGYTLTKTQFNVIKLIVKLETTLSFVGIIDAIIKTMPFCITDCKTNSLKSATSLSALTRVFVYLCRMKHRIQPVRNLVYQVMCEMYSESSIVVYEAVTAWPILIPEVNENTANSLTDLKILPQCLVYVMLSYDADKNIHDKYKVPQLFDFLSLKFHFQRGERSSLQLLQHISDRLEGGEVPGVKSGLLLLCYCESVAWRKMLIVFLIPIVMKYATSPVADQAAQVAAKVIGQVAHTFLLSKTSTVSQIVLKFKMLLQQLDISAGLRQQLQMSLELLQPGSNKQ